MDRAALVAQLLNGERPLRDALASLAEYGRDCDAPLCKLEPSHIQHLLQRFIGGEWSAGQVEQWANAIECRDDIDCDPNSPEGEVLFELANPELTQPLDQARAKQLLQLLVVGT